METTTNGRDWNEKLLMKSSQTQARGQEVNLGRNNAGYGLWETHVAEDVPLRQRVPRRWAGYSGRERK